MKFEIHIVFNISHVLFEINKHTNSLCNFLKNMRTKSSRNQQYLLHLFRRNNRSWTSHLRIWKWSRRLRLMLSRMQSESSQKLWKLKKLQSQHQSFRISISSIQRSHARIDDSTRSRTSCNIFSNVSINIESQICLRCCSLAFETQRSISDTINKTSWNQHSWVSELRFCESISSTLRLQS